MPKHTRTCKQAKRRDRPKRAAFLCFAVGMPNGTHSYMKHFGNASRKKTQKEKKLGLIYQWKPDSITLSAIINIPHRKIPILLSIFSVQYKNVKDWKRIKIFSLSCFFKTMKKTTTHTWFSIKILNSFHR